MTSSSGDAEFDVGGFFQPYVLQWLVDTDNKTGQWVQAVSRLVLYLSSRNLRAIDRLSLQTKFVPSFICIFVELTAYLQFQAEGPEGHSSSIIDLFDSLRSPIGFLQDLEWTDEYMEATFFTSIAKVFIVYLNP